MYKIPGRSIVCDTIGGWVMEMLWIYVIRVVWKMDIDAITSKPENPTQVEVWGQKS